MLIPLGLKSIPKLFGSVNTRFEWESHSDFDLRSISEFPFNKTGKNKEHIDLIASTIILQSFLDKGSF